MRYVAYMLIIFLILACMIMVARIAGMIASIMEPVRNETHTLFPNATKAEFFEDLRPYINLAETSMIIAFVCAVIAMFMYSRRRD